VFSRDRRRPAEVGQEAGRTRRARIRGHDPWLKRNVNCCSDQHRRRQHGRQIRSQCKSQSRTTRQGLTPIYLASALVLAGKARPSGSLCVLCAAGALSILAATGNPLAAHSAPHRNARHRAGRHHLKQECQRAKKREDGISMSSHATYQTPRTGSSVP